MPRVLIAAVVTLGLLIVPPASARAEEDDGGLLFRFSEQEAAFESFQVNRLFFLCVTEAANANLAPATEQQTLAEAGRCLRRLVQDDAMLDLDGVQIRGVEGVVDVVTGLLADVRQNVSVSLEAPLVLRFVPGRRLGTGEIQVSFEIGVTQEVVAAGPFGSVLGGQIATFRNRMTLRARRPGLWQIHEFTVRQQSAESGLDIDFPSPFPRFPIEFPRQRGVSTR